MIKKEISTGLWAQSLTLNWNRAQVIGEGSLFSIPTPTNSMVESVQLLWILFVIKRLLKREKIALGSIVRQIRLNLVS